MRRRGVLSVLAGTLTLSGCTAGYGTGDGGTPEGTDTPDGSGDLPDSCPVSEDLGVEWPTDLNADTVEQFVEAYERQYVREVVVEYEPETQLDSYELSGEVTDPPRQLGDGWSLAYRGGGGIYEPELLFGATPADPPENADVVPIGAFEDNLLPTMLEEAAAEGEAERHVGRPRERVDEYVESLASLSEDFGGLSAPGDRDSLYVDVDGTIVELTVVATSLHGDYGWHSWYYVDEHVVRRLAGSEVDRSTPDSIDPREGELLECRSP